MVDFDEIIVMREGFLNRLNNAIDKVIQEKSEIGLDYKLLEKALGAMIMNKAERRTSHISKIIPIKKEKMLAITLDFFKSIDQEFYKKAVNIILQQHNNIKMNIYNLHEIKNFEEKGEFGIPEYTRGGSVYSNNGNAIIHIPTKRELDYKEEKFIEKDTGTLNDVYTLVHEIAHIFDLDLEGEKLSREELASKNIEYKTHISRELIGESTAIAFEGLLTEYLLRNTSYSKDAIREISIRIENGLLMDAKIVYAKLLLAREKEKSGEIKNSYIEEIMRRNNFSVQFMRRMANRIISDPRNMQFEKRYAIAGLVAPTIIKKYKEEGAETIKKYLESAKANEFNSAMHILGIKLNEQGLNNLIKNMREQESILEEGR